MILILDGEVVMTGTVSLGVDTAQATPTVESGPILVVAEKCVAPIWTRCSTAADNGDDQDETDDQ
jgi:phage gp36-like protein